MKLRLSLLIVFTIITHSCASKAIEFDPKVDCESRAHMGLKILNSHPTYTYDPKELSQWMESKTPKKKAVALLIHGLNFRPSKMNSLGHFLSSHGVDVLRVSLAGHKGSKPEGKKVTRDQWVSEFRDHYCLADKRAKELNLPLYAIGFSLGGLIPVDFILSSPKKTEIKKLVLLAPAIKVRWYSHIPTFLSGLGGWISLPSGNIKQYRSQSTTSLAAYGAMADARKSLKNATKEKLNLETLVLADPDDELIDPSKIDKMIENIGLSNWKHIPIDNSKSQLEKTFHHLIIDKPTLGKPGWERLLGHIRDHLKL